MKFGCFGLNSRDVSAIDRMRDGLAMLERLRGNLRVSLFRAMIADACHAVGDAAAGLAEIDESFTEGFDTLNLREAKALLDELHA